ncbi:MAG: electron transport complex subunit RsxC [Clostridia bacterium]|nr:electron transport complex subunit RsxC [Clostridia bacterium]
MALTFKGGTHLKQYKNTKKFPIEKMTPPSEISISMSQHIGAPCVPTVNVGDYVFQGQIIGEPAENSGCPIHASVSGKIKAITSYKDMQGRHIQTVVIENDGKYELSPNIIPTAKKLTEVTSEEIIEIVRRAGILGMGGAAFPTYAKIQSAIGKAEKLIVNCAECEPFITADHRLMLERPLEIINGTKILLKAIGSRKAYIAIEDNKMDAVEKLEEKIGKSQMIKMKILRSKYPQGDERQLVYAITKKEIPSGKLPTDVGCVVFNAETCAAVFRAFVYGMPSIEKIVTVSGDAVTTPKNVLAPIGASYRDLISFCDGLKKDPRKLICGGPMMGTAQSDLDAPITKGTSALLVFSDEMCHEEDENYTCIRCGRCVNTCPMRLMPNYLAQFSRNGRYEDCEKYDVMSCVECGTCSYSCPGHVPIVQHIRSAKEALRKKATSLPDLDKK